MTELTGYWQASLSGMIEEARTDVLMGHLSSFSCPRNLDVEDFLKNKAVPLIGQLGKNYLNGYDKLITGDELLELAFDKIRTMQMCVGGKFAYLECAEIPELIAFYKRNGFTELDVRRLSPAEIGLDGHDAYMQMIKYF